MFYKITALGADNKRKRRMAKKRPPKTLKPLIKERLITPNKRASNNLITPNISP